MEKYREINWNKEIKIEKERNEAKTKKPITSQEDQMNNNNSIKQGKLNVRAACRLVVLIALGTMLGNCLSYFGYKFLTTTTSGKC